MKRLFAWGTALLLVGGMQAALLPVDEPITPVDYVSTLVGTQSKHALSTGNTYPAVAMPWGMNFWTPQTGTMGDGWAYTYDADKIRGFKHTHQPSPWINELRTVCLAYHRKGGISTRTSVPVGFLIKPRLPLLIIIKSILPTMM